MGCVVTMDKTWNGSVTGLSHLLASADLNGTLYEVLLLRGQISAESFQSECFQNELDECKKKFCC